jgi:hypothetical protein
MPLRQQLAACYREAGARGRRLLTAATSPWLKERLGAEIARCEQIAEQIEQGSSPDANDTTSGVTAIAQEAQCRPVPWSSPWD